MTESDRRARILVVEDMPNWREQLVEILGNDYDIEVFSTFEDAERAIDVLNFDVAVLDVRLEDPSRDVKGFALLRKIREKKLEVGIVILTGYHADVTQKALETYRPDAFIKKEAFQATAFRDTIRRIVGQDKIVRSCSVS